MDIKKYFSEDFVIIHFSCYFQDEGIEVPTYSIAKLKFNSPDTVIIYDITTPHAIFCFKPGKILNIESNKEDNMLVVAEVKEINLKDSSILAKILPEKKPFSRQILRIQVNPKDPVYFITVINKKIKIFKVFDINEVAFSFIANKNEVDINEDEKLSGILKFPNGTRTEIKNSEILYKRNLNNGKVMYIVAINANDKDSLHVRQYIIQRQQEIKNKIKQVSKT